MVGWRGGQPAPRGWPSPHPRLSETKRVSRPSRPMRSEPSRELQASARIEVRSKPKSRRKRPGRPLRHGGLVDRLRLAPRPDRQRPLPIACRARFSARLGWCQQSHGRHDDACAEPSPTSVSCAARVRTRAGWKAPSSCYSGSPDHERSCPDWSGIGLAADTAANSSIGDNLP